MAPASLVTIHAETKTATWTDVDGDLLTLKWTGVTAPAFADHAPVGAVAGGTLIDSIALANAKDVLTLTVKAAGGGDGHVNLGYINASHLRLESFSAPLASVLEFDAGDTIHAISSLILGSYGTENPSAFTTPGGDNSGKLDGNVGSVKIIGDLDYGSLSIGHAQGNNDPIVSTNGKIKIGGSLHGNVAQDGYNGNLNIHGTAGTVRIGGSVIGGGFGSGTVSVGTVESFSLGGDIVGGQKTGAGQVIIGSTSPRTKVSVAGSIEGGYFDTGNLLVVIAQSVFIGGNINASSSDSGIVTVFDVGSVTIEGSIVGAQVLNPSQDLLTAGLTVSHYAGTVFVGHNIIAGTTTHTDSGTTVDTRNGYIGGNGNIGTLTVGGSVEGNNNTRVILSAEGTTPVAAGNFNAINHVIINGAFTYGVLISGQSAIEGPLGTAANSDAGIGKITIGGSFYHSSIMAGTNDLDKIGVGRLATSTTSNDTQSVGDATRFAVLGPISIAGGILDDANANGYSGFEGEQITKITVGGNVTFTHGSPIHFFDPTHFIFAEEIPAT